MEISLDSADDLALFHVIHLRAEVTFTFMHNFDLTGEVARSGP